MSAGPTKKDVLLRPLLNEMVRIGEVRTGAAVGTLQGSWILRTLACVART